MGLRQLLGGDLALLQQIARAGKAKGTASVGGEVACACELMFVAVDA